MVHAFDLMVADGYANDGVTTRFGPRHDKWSSIATAPAAARALSAGRTSDHSIAAPSLSAAIAMLRTIAQRLVRLVEAAPRPRQAEAE